MRESDWSSDVCSSDLHAAIQEVHFRTSSDWCRRLPFWKCSSWPDNCLLVAIQRGTDEIIPKGKTKLQAGDLIVTMTDERDMGVIHEKMEALCQERF